MNEMERSEKKQKEKQKKKGTWGIK